MLLCLAAQVAEPATPSSANLRTLHTINEVYALSSDQAKLGYPVDIESVITYIDVEWGMLFIQDKTGYSFINLHGSKNHTNFPAGSHVLVKGVTASNGGGVDITKPKIEFLRAGPEIQPTSRLISELDAAPRDSLLVAAEGVLHPCIDPGERICFRIVAGKKEALLIVPELHSTATDRLIGATVRALGVCAARMDNAGKRIGSTLFSENLKDIQVEMPPLAENTAPVTVQSLHPEDADLTMVRQVHMRGRVNWVSNSLFALQDETGTIFVKGLTPVIVHIGDPVDVIGFPSHGRFGLELQDSTVRVITEYPVPVKITPLNNTVEEMLKDSLNGRRVQLKARLEGQEEDSAQITFHLADHDQLFTAVLLLSENSRKVETFPKGSTLELSGVELLQSASKNLPPSVLILIESPESLIVRHGENWLTWQRALVILGFTALCLLVPLAWVKQLKRTVQRQVAINKQQMEKELQLATKYQRLFERNLAAVYTLRPDGAITECNDAFLKLLGVDDLSQLECRSYWEFEIESNRREELKSGKQTEMMSNCQATLCRDDGSVVYLLKNVTPVETPEGIVYETTAIDVTQMRRHQVELQHSRDAAVMNSLIDPLTELPNRRMLMDSLPAILEDARHAGHSLALLFIDLDRFKPVNDNLGHAAGDEVLIHIANTMRSRVRKGDSLARIGGDEFMLILSDLRASEDAVRVAEDMRNAIEKPIPVLDQTVHVSASIGISIFPTDGSQADELIARADTAMYAAKRQGRNRFVFYSNQMQDAAEEEQKPAVQL
jgi:diguanylate cyclase (GGDEF)-like protein/PAS domain S-box-containing protein